MLAVIDKTPYKHTELLAPWNFIPGMFRYETVSANDQNALKLISAIASICPMAIFVVVVVE